MPASVSLSFVPHSIYPLHWVALSDLGLYIEHAGLEITEMCLPLLCAGINIKGQRTVLLKAPGQCPLGGGRHPPVNCPGNIRSQDIAESLALFSS